MFDMGLGDFEKPALGIWPVWCTSLIDLGTQQGSYMGQPKSSRKIIFGFELPTQLHKKDPNKGEPMRLQSTMTASMGDNANLRALVTGWRGAVFADDKEAAHWAKVSLHKVVGRPAQAVLALSRDGKYVNLGTLAKLDPATAATLPKPKSKLVCFSLNALLWGTPTPAQLAALPADERAAIQEMSKAFGPMQEVFKTLPEKIRAKIATSPQYLELVSGGGGEDSQPDVEDGLHDPAEDEVPF